MAKHTSGDPNADDRFGRLDDGDMRAVARRLSWHRSDRGLDALGPAVGNDILCALT